jgi:site-specific recombinase XerD
MTMEQDYHIYLQRLRQSPRTIKSYSQYIEKLQSWCKSKSIEKDTISYKELMKYIAQLKPNHQTNTINVHLTAIRHYFNHLIEKGYLAENIAEGLMVRGETKKVLQNLLDSDELEDLYYSYETTSLKPNFYFNATAKRNKIIVGLLVYQGLVSNNFLRIKVEDVNLSRGTIYIASTRKNASRKIPLKPWQIMQLKEYIEEVLPIIQKHIGVYNNRLFPLNTGQFNVLLFPIFKKLKSYNRKVTNNNGIRASVIVNWLNKYNIREVQELAGHRHICSTESYKQDDLENLQKVVENFHPIQ